MIRSAVGWAALVAAYFGAAQLGLAVEFVNGTVSPVWPAAGLAIAALALWGLPLWPAVAIGAFGATFLLAGKPLPVAVCIALGNTLEAVLGALVLRRLQVWGEVARVRDAMAILAVAALAPIFSATAGVSSLMLGGMATWEQYPWAWLVWWLGNFMGALVVLPVMLAWAGQPSTVKYPARPLEFAGAMALSVILTSFAYLNGDLLPDLNMPFLPPGAFVFPPMVWAILRLRPRETALVVALAGSFAVMFTLAGTKDEIIGPLLWLQMVLVSVGGGALLLTGGIAERAQAEQALRENRERLSLALKAGRSGTFQWDAETGACRWSDELLTLYGLTSFGGRYKDWLACVVPEDQALAREAGQRVIQKGEIEIVFRIRRGDNGEVRWMHGRAKLLKGAAGQHPQMIGIQMDITDRKRADVALKESERRLGLALEAGGSSVWEMEVASGAVMYQGQFPVTLGYAPSELGTLADCAAIVQDDDRSGVLEGIDELIQGRLDNARLECRLRAKDGTWRWVLLQAIAAERDVRRQALRIVGAATDITQRKLVETQIQRLNAELEQRVQHRTAELEHANEALLYSNMELQHFAHATAHDLQTPLRSIAGFAQLVQQEVQGRVDDRVDEWSSQVVSNTKRLQILIQELLAYSRLDAQGRPFEVVDLGQVLDEVAASLVAMIQESGAEISSGPLPTVSADRTQMAQLLQNLIENGIKYNRTEPPRVAIACEPRDGEWLFSVADNGIGIDPRHHDRIFEIFRRLHTYAQVPGTGIGLALCRRIVERHGGCIWIESQPGEGSTVYFTLAASKPAKIGMGK